VRIGSEREMWVGGKRSEGGLGLDWD